MDDQKNPAPINAQDAIDDTVQSSTRAQGVKNVLQFFRYSHLPENLQRVSRPFAELAMHMLGEVEDSAELTAGLRKLLESKDCMVRAKLIS